VADKSEVELGLKKDEMDDAISQVEDTWTKLGQHVNSVGEAAQDKWRKVGEAIVAAAVLGRQAWQTAVDYVQTLIDTVWDKLKTGTRQFTAAQADITQLVANIKATQSAAGFAADALEKMNRHLQEMSVHGAEAWRNAQQTLLQFKNVRGDVFLDALKTASDLAAVIGGSLSSAVGDLGKQLNDPIQALKDLDEQGIEFTKRQKEMINVALKNKDVMGLQRMVLEKLNELYGGAGQAATKTFVGQMAKLGNAIDNIFMKLGSLLVPVIQEKLIPIMEKAARVVDFLVGKIKPTGISGKIFDELMKVSKIAFDYLLKAGLRTFTYIQTLAQNWGVFWKVLWRDAQAVALQSLIFVVQGVQWLVEQSTRLLGRVLEWSKEVWKSIAAAGTVAAGLLLNVWGSVSEFFSKMWNSMVDIAGKAWEMIGIPMMDWFHALVGFTAFAVVMFKAMFDLFIDLSVTGWKMGYYAAKFYWDYLLAVPRFVIKHIVGAFYELLQAVKIVFEGLASLTIKTFELMGGLVGQELKGMFRTAQDVFGGMLDVVMNFFGGMESGAGTVFEEIFEWFRLLGVNVMFALGTKVKDAMKPAFDAMDKVGKAFDDARDKAAKMADDAKNKFAGAFGNGGGGAGNLVDGLKKKLDDLHGNGDAGFGAGFDKNLKDNQARLDQFLKDIKDATKAQDSFLNTPSKADFFFGKKGAGDSKGGGGGPGPFTELLELNRRIQGAALQSAEARAIDKQTGYMAKWHAEDLGKANDTIAVLKDVKDAVKEANPRRMADGGIAPAMGRGALFRDVPVTFPGGGF